MIFTCAITLQISLCLFSNLSLVLKSAGNDPSGSRVPKVLQFLRFSFIYEAVDRVTFAFQYSQTSENFKAERNIGVLKTSDNMKSVTKKL